MFLIRTYRFDVMSTMKGKGSESALKSRLENTERALAYLSKRRQENIKKSLIRPLYQEILKCIFIVFVMLIDVFIPLQILIEMPTPVNSIGSIIALIIFLCIEIKIYQMIWGKNGCWSIEKCKITSKKID
jgi:hypothetical protein